MYDPHRERLYKKRSKYWNMGCFYSDNKRRAGIVFRTPCLCSCPMCAGVKDNSPLRYKFSDIKKLEKAKEEINEAF
ncbi:hypothetical protein U7154_000020 [Kononvirus KKP3711]|uniref:Uncharacterized protein n=1 Tax=Enterobacter phage KKP_3711 TaxID=3109398 RepID=A0AAX4Q464_9CAUD